MTTEISAEEFNAMQAAAKRPKYGNRVTEVDGYTFDSAAEARHYETLRLRVLAGEITELELQPRFELVVNGQKITRYTADFSYRDRDGVRHVVDVKGGNATKTRDYVMRRKLMRAIHGVDVEEVTA